MGKTRPSKSSKSGSKSNKAPKSKALNTETPEILHAQAATSLQTGDPESALPKALKALSLTPESDQSRLPVLNLLGEIYLELGDQAKGYEAYHEAVEIDRSVSSDSSIPGTGPEKYFCLAQLSEEGGKASLAWFEEGIQILERNVQELESKKGKDAQIELKDCRKQLSGALCGIIELWMTDLSFESEAESQCDLLIARALLANPIPNASTLQTLASIRLSQQRMEDAQSALRRSLETWQDLPPEHPDVPDYPERISLARLLMEAQMEEEALEVVERLVGEDDESIEAWYLGGWCLYLMANKDLNKDADVDGEEKMQDDKEDEEDLEDEYDRTVLKLSSREWLRNSLKLYDLLQYEDERLREHAKELVDELEKELQDVEIEDDDDEVEWDSEDDDEEDEDEGEDEDEDEDEEMEG